MLSKSAPLKRSQAPVGAPAPAEGVEPAVPAADAAVVAAAPAPDTAGPDVAVAGPAAGCDDVACPVTAARSGSRGRTSLTCGAVLSHNTTAAIPIAATTAGMPTVTNRFARLRPFLRRTGARDAVSAVRRLLPRRTDEGVRRLNDPGRFSICAPQCRAAPLADCPRVGYCVQICYAMSAMVSSSRHLGGPSVGSYPPLLGKKVRQIGL